MNNRLLSIVEASEYLGITKGTLYSWVCQRKIPVVKMGSLNKFDIKDLDQWIEEHKRKTKEW